MSELRLPAQRVCIVLLMRIGDVVWGMPVVNALKRDDPSRHITWVVESIPAPLLQPHPGVDRVITFDRKRGPKELVRLWRELRSEEFDLVLCASHYIKSAVPTAIARAPNKISYGPDRASDLQWMFSNHNLPPRRGGHMQERYLEFLDYLGLAWRGALEWRISITEEEKRVRDEFFTRFEDRPVVGIVASSYETSKNWPSDRFGMLASALKQDFGFEVLLLGGPGTLERERAEEVDRAAGGGLASSLGDDLRRLICLLDGCSLMISVDTGPLHIARALETPVIGLYGSTDPERYGPYGAYEDLWVDRHNFLGPNEPTGPPAPGERARRMELISVDDVLERVERARERYALTKRPV